MTALLTPARTGFVDVSNPGTPDKTHWRGAALTKPWIYDNTSVDGKYYLYFTSLKWSIALDDWYECVGVASATDIGGPYSYENSDAPILEPTLIATDWNGLNVSCGCVVDNPNHEAASLLEFRGDFTVECLIYLDSAITGADPYIFRMCKADGTPVAWMRFYDSYSANSPNHHSIVAGVRMGNTNYETAVSQYVIPKVGALVYCSMAFDTVTATLQCCVKKNDGDTGGIRIVSFTAGTQIDASPGGTFYFMGGTSWKNTWYLKSVRVKNIYVNYDTIQAAGYVDNILTAGKMRETEYTVFLHNASATGLSVWNKPANEAEEETSALASGVAYVTNKGYHMSGATGKIQLYSPFTQKYMMLVSARNGAGILGYAFSNDLITGWTFFPCHILDDSAVNALIADSYITGAQKRVGGIDNPRLFLKSGAIYYLVYAKETVATHWRIEVRETSKFYILPTAKSVILDGRYLHNGNGNTDFDYRGIPGAHVLKGVPYVNGDSSWENTLVYEGDAVYDPNGEDDLKHIHGVAILGGSL